MALARRAPSTVHRIGQVFGPQPHRVETFKLSGDPGGASTAPGQGFAAQDWAPTDD
jgi:hypothetical protein